MLEETLSLIPAFVDTNFQVVDMEMYKEADNRHRATLKFYITKDVNITDRNKTIWRVGYAHSGLPELSQIAFKHDSLGTALDELLKMLEK